MYLLLNQKVCSLLQQIGSYVPPFFKNFIYKVLIHYVHTFSYCKILF